MIRNDDLIQALKAEFINCWVPISQVTLAGSVASVTFSSIPGNFRTLVLGAQARTDRVSIDDSVLWRANGDSGSNYDRVFVAGLGNNTRTSGGNVATTAGLASQAEAANSRASNFGNGLCFFQGYALTDREKQSVAIASKLGDRTLANMSWLGLGSGWRDNSAITSLTLIPETGPNFVSGSVFALYGIL